MLLKTILLLTVAVCAAAAVRVDGTINERSIQLSSIKLADRTSQARWRIRVTQQEFSNTGEYRDGLLAAITASLPSTPFITTADGDEYRRVP